MSGLGMLLENHILICAIVGWLVAQVAKTIIYMLVNRQFRPERLVGDGGMPSAHSATVSAMATASAMTYGLDSFQFAVTAILAIIVMHDAMGVRLETGKQAKLLNEWANAFKSFEGLTFNNTEKLKEFVGHTPLQVFAGALLGILIGFFMS